MADQDVTSRGRTHRHAGFSNPSRAFSAYAVKGSAMPGDFAVFDEFSEAHAYADGLYGSEGPNRGRLHVHCLYFEEGENGAIHLRVHDEPPARTSSDDAGEGGSNA